MSNLKTLKDIKFNAGVNFMKYHKLRNSDPFVTKEELKQEAIKWVKAKQFNQREPLNASDWKHFFNITSEDLK